MVARVEGDGFVGRSTYWDGYPQTMGHQLFLLAQGRFSHEDGLEAMMKVLVDDHQGWSVIKAGIDQTYMNENGLTLAEASELVEGIGIAYTDFVEEEILRGKEGEVLDMSARSIEWVYAVEVETAKLHIYEVNRQTGIPTQVGWASLESPEPDWTTIECGSDLQRCRHVAFVHAERFGLDADHPSARLSVKQLLGEEPLNPYNAIGAIYKSQRHTFTGNGRREADGNFYMETIVNGKKSKLNQSAAGVKLIYPKLLAELVRSGEIQDWRAAARLEEARQLWRATDKAESVVEL
jgi:hypothetical protein